jgi:hypothetical protein
MPTHPATTHESVEQTSFSDEAVERLLAIDGVPPHVSDAYLRRWLGTASPFLAYGRAALLFAEERGAIAVTFNPRVTGTPFAGFSFLRLAPGLSATERQTVAQSLLQEAKQWAQAQGAKHLRGPLPFSTWHPYRVVDTDTGARPFRFPGESVEDRAIQELYRSAGLEITDRYETRMLVDGQPPWDPLLKMESLMRRRSRYQIRPLAPAEVGARMARIFEMVSATFSNNAYYSPIDPAEFAELMGGGAAKGYSLGAFSPEDEFIGFCVGYAHDGVGILKTLGVAPEYRGSYVAMGLTFEFHRQLKQDGLRTALHAMMKDDNASQSMSAKYAQPLRSYVLYGCAVD